MTSLGERDVARSPYDRTPGAALGHTLDVYITGGVTPSDWLSEPGSQWPVDPTVGNHPIAGYHHLGGTRLGSDPASSVTDPECKVHGYANLHVAGSSVFPTAGWANPTLTLVALAIRLAAKLSR